MNPKSEELLARCKAIAILVTALGGFGLGILNFIVFKEETQAKRALAQAKAGYSELAHQVEATSKDIQHLAESIKDLQERIRSVETWLLYERNLRGSLPGPTENKIRRRYKTQQKPIPMPAPRKPTNWDALQRQVTK